MDKQPNEPVSREPTLFDALSDAQPPQAENATTRPTESITAAGQSDPTPIELASASETQVADEPLVGSPVTTPEASVAPVETPLATAEVSDPLPEPAAVMTDMPTAQEPEATQPNTVESPASPVQDATQVPAVAAPAAAAAETTMIGELSPDTQLPGGPVEVASPAPVARTNSVELEAQAEHAGLAPVPPASPAEPLRPVAKPQRPTGAWWTIPMICVGLAMVACALIVGQVEINRQVAWQRNKLKIDLEYLQAQLKQNEEFLQRIQTDPTLAERLAQRQMKQVREGSAILEVPGLPHQNERNPFQLTTIPPPKPLAPYRPRADLLTYLFADPQYALWAIGIGLMLVAAGLVLGGPDDAAEDQR